MTTLVDARPATDITPEFGLDPGRFSRGESADSDPETIHEPEKLTDLECLLAAITLREEPDGLVGSTLREIGDLRSRIELITTALRARGLTPPVDGYLGHEEVMSMVSQLELNCTVADIPRDHDSVIHDAFDVVGVRNARTRYSPDNMAFQKWLAANQKGDDLGHIQWLQWQSTLHMDDPKRVSDADWRRFQSLYEKWWESDESVANRRIVADTFESAFGQLGIDRDLYLSAEPLLEQRMVLTDKARELLLNTLPELKRVRDQTRNIEDELSTDFHEEDLELALVRYIIENPSTQVSDATLRPEKIALVPPVEAAGTYLRIAREYLNMRRKESQAKELSRYALRAAA